MDHFDSHCPVCGCSFARDDENIICHKCGVPHHLECWEYNDGCAVYACKTSKPVPCSVSPGSITLVRGNGLDIISKLPLPIQDQYLTIFGAILKVRSSSYVLGLFFSAIALPVYPLAGQSAVHTVPWVFLATYLALTIPYLLMKISISDHQWAVTEHTSHKVTDFIDATSTPKWLQYMENELYQLSVGGIAIMKTAIPWFLIVSIISPFGPSIERFFIGMAVVVFHGCLILFLSGIQKVIDEKYETLTFVSESLCPSIRFIE